MRPIGLALLLSFAHGAASAEVIYPGINYDVQGGYHVVVADLASSGIEVRVQHPYNDASDGNTVAGHAVGPPFDKSEGAYVAINANFFAYASLACGAARGFGQQFSMNYGEAGNCDTSLMWTPISGQGGVFGSGGHEHDPGFHPEFTDQVSGAAQIVAGGAPGSCNYNKLETGRDCTAAGISSDRTKFIFVASDSTVCSCAGLQNALISHGAGDAVQLDGGGSTNMWIRGKGYVTDETQHRSLPVSIIARPNGACPSDCGGTQCLQVPRPFGAQCLGQSCRSGMGSIWNCDADKKRRVRCDPTSGLVAKEYCAMGCQPMALNSDDVCLGGAIPEPGPPDMAVVPDAGSHPDGGASHDGAVPSAHDGGADGPRHGTTMTGGCALAPAQPMPATLPLALVALAAILFARRRAQSSAATDA